MVNRTISTLRASYVLGASRKKMPPKAAEIAVKAQIVKTVTRLRIFDKELAQELIRERQKRGIDRYDEVWDGVYVMPSMPQLSHQEMVHDLEVVLDVIIVKQGRGKVYPGANVSDRRVNWKKNFRVPDIVVLLNNSQAINYGTFIYGGPDFLVEIYSPTEAPQEKIPFYEKVQVQELLLIHRDSRELLLYRHNGKQLVQVPPREAAGGKWLDSRVVSLSFRTSFVKGIPRIELRRTDGKIGKWTI